MSKRIVHYINQFFAGIGGEEKADIAPEVREGIVGPGLAFKTALGEGYEIVATVICGVLCFLCRKRECNLYFLLLDI